MDLIRGRIVKALKDRFPEMADSIKPFAALLDEQGDQQVSFSAPGILVAILPVQEAPEQIPYDLRANWGLVVSVKGGGALARDVAGWKLAVEAAQVVYRNCWQMQGMVTPAILTSLTKNDVRDAQGTPTGSNYWTVTFYNYIKFEAVI